MNRTQDCGGDQGRASRVFEVDSRLVAVVRSGDRKAFGELYDKHYVSTHRFACKLIGSTQGADDLIAESFFKVMQRILAGGGPTSAFRPYLLATVRTTFYKQLAGERMIDRRVELPEAVVDAADVDAAEADPVVARLDAELAAMAFASLRERWRTALVLLEVEAESTRALAHRLGIQPNAAAALAFRAREALRIAYVQMHVKTPAEEACREPATNLAAWSCGRLRRSLRLRVQQHLAGCSRCSTAAREVSDLLAELGRSVPLTAPISVPRINDAGST